jgi:hypothetical protein
VGRFAPFAGPAELARASSTTDASGRFEVEVADPGVRPIAARFFVPEDATFRSVSSESTLSAGARALEDLELRRVAHGTLHGTTVDRDGRPIPGVRLRFTGRQGKWSAETVSDPNGAFRIEAFRDFGGVEALAPGLTLLDSTRPLPLESGGWTPTRIVLVPETNLRVRVLGPSGEPIERTPVYVSVAAPELPGSYPGPLGSSTEKRADTGADGIATFEGIWTDTRLQIRLVSVGEPSSTQARLGSSLLFDAEPGTGTPIVARRGEELELEVRLVGFELGGKAVFADGRPASKPKISVFDDGCAPGEKRLLVVANGDEEGSFWIASGRVYWSAILAQD